MLTDNVLVGSNPFLIKTLLDNATVLLRTIDNWPAYILNIYWSVLFETPHSLNIPGTGSADDLDPKVNPLILPGWYLKTLLDCIVATLRRPVAYPGLVLVEV